jgi:hypothetical protein
MPITTVSEDSRLAARHSSANRRVDACRSAAEERRAYERTVGGLLVEHADDIVVRAVLRLDGLLRRLIWSLRLGR